MSFTNTGGGDHEGLDWTPDGDTIAGIHYNIDTFTVSNGQTATIDVGTELKIFANIVSIIGTIQGTGKGYAGGAGGQETTYGQAGSGPGGGGYGAGSVSWYSGGGGAGYTGAGGNGGKSSGAPGAGGGSSNGASTDPIINMGSGGGGGASHNFSCAGAGGRGGGSISLYSPSVTISGSILCTGAGGGSGGAGCTGGGAGSGGGILIVGNEVTITSGTLNVAGGTGGGCGLTGGGGGSAGRIKICCLTSSLSGITTVLTAGAAGTCCTAATCPTAGAAGSYNLEVINQCTASLPIGQTFTIGANSASLIEKINLWITTVDTSGDFSLKVWDSSSKNTEYATKTVTISSTGLITFTFSDWIRIPNGESTYYMELTTAGAGDIELGVYGISTLCGGDFYRNVYIVSRFDLYHQIYSVDHIKNPSVYNMADTTTKTDVANVMLIGAVHTINTDGTGTLQYTDNFTTNKYLGNYNTISGVTHDAGNDELDIADAGYITYLIDTKYPINGIPQLTSTIDITTGTPTVQISSNGSTWYDIDTAVVDDISTVYPLDNVSNLSLDQLTSFYLRFDCAGDGTNTATIKTFTLDLNITTIDAENFYVNTGASNTIRCDQATDSGIDCVVLLTYRDRAWA